MHRKRFTMKLERGDYNMYKVMDVARYIINYSNEHQQMITNLKLQKILYFVQADFLVNKDEPCFEESIEAWDFGPVVPDVYHEYKKYGSRALPSIKEYIDFRGNIWDSKVRNYDKNIICVKDREMINEMVDSCSEYSAGALVEITHNQAPWLEAYRSGWNNVIENDNIKKFFEG